MTKELIRKLRGEVSTMYVANGVSDALWLIEKYNSNPDIPGENISHLYMSRVLLLVSYG